MTQEDKKLLLVDLCAKLPYGVICECYHTEFNEWDGKPFVANYNETLINIDVNGVFFAGGFSYEIDEVKPYLRPMSSMTEEERKEIGILIRENRPNPYGIINNNGVDNLLFSVSVTSRLLIDWLNAHHFDYRGLIEKGLAIEVTKENNPYKK